MIGIYGPVFKNIGLLGNSLVVQWLGLDIFHCHGPGSIPGQGTKILQAAQCSQKKTGLPTFNLAGYKYWKQTKKRFHQLWSSFQNETLSQHQISIHFALFFFNLANHLTLYLKNNNNNFLPIELLKLCLSGLCSSISEPPWWPISLPALPSRWWAVQVLG